jgi:hypothetical protein
MTFEEVDSMVVTKILCILLLAGGLAWPAFAAQGDTGSGPTTGTTSTNDAGSGPTKGADPSLNKPTGPQTDRDRPPGDAQTSDKRGERAQTPAPQGSMGAGQTAATNRGATGDARPAPSR